MTNRGKIIYLNGISSAGKSTIAKELHQRLTEPYLYTGIDVFIWMVQDRYWNDDPAGFVIVQDETGSRIQAGPVAQQLDQAMLHTIAALATNGNNVLVDDVILAPESLRRRVELLANLDLWYIGVKCPLEVVEQRELSRGDRLPGLARAQFYKAHQPDIYDLEVDTSKLNPVECAEKIMAGIKENSEPKAFKALKKYNW